ncbi:MAG TPA: tyrosine-type recombinase/integrase [Alphaproteobacteria bacterium]|nr:tyrosine-type recombinase/integrase [Alphaproteobacteria bacterium]
MARNGDYKYLEQRRLGWYIKVELPPSMRAAFNGKRRIVKSLKTRDLDEARRRRWSALRDIKAEIEAKRQGYMPSTVLDEALRWRTDVEGLRAKGDDVTAEVVEGLISDRAREIDHENGGVAAVGFFGVARGEAEPLQPLSERWLAEIKDDVKTQTLGQYRLAVGKLLDFLGAGATIESVTRRKAGEFVSVKLLPAGITRKTVARHISALSSFWRWLNKRGFVEENPWSNQAPPKGKSSHKRPFTEDELVRLMAGTPKGSIAGRVLPDLMRLALLSGARLEELCSLKVKDVSDGTLSIRDSKTRAADRDIPIHPLAKPMIERRTKQWHPGDFLFPNLIAGGPDNKLGWNLSKAFTVYRRSVGVGGVTREVDFHSFRRCFATALEHAMVPQNVAAELIGHTKQDMTFGLYSGGLTAEPLKDAVEKVDFGDAVMDLLRV